MSVREAQERIDSREFAEWVAYYKIDPFGNKRGDMQAGIIAASNVNLWSKGKVSPADFMPEFETRTMTLDEFKAALRGGQVGNDNS